MEINIRQEEQKDYSKVEQATEEAFREAEHTDYSEHFLVNRLRKSDAFVKELSLVAEVANEIVAHCLLTEAYIDTGANKVKTLALAPVSVIQQYQGKGVGTKLITEGLKRATSLGYDSVIVLGHDKYYPRFGFVPASNYGIKAPFEVPDENFMAVELKVGALQGVKGTIVYAKEFFE